MAEHSLHEIRISFDAPPLKEMNPGSLTIEKTKEFEANFQWVKYALLFTDKDMNWYSYLTPLYPWGERQEGGQQIFASDSIGNIDEKKEVKIPVEEVEKEFSKYLNKPELDPRAQVAYVNANKSDRHKYSSEEFKKSFVSSGRYIVLTKDRRYVDPFGRVVGKKGQPPKEEKMATDTFRQAVKNAKEKDYFTGGFDIMKKLVKKQHQDQQKKKSAKKEQ